MSGEGSNGFDQTAVKELTKPLEELLPSEPDFGADLDAEMRKSIFEKISFKWRTEDRLILTRIQALVDQEFADNFADVVPVLDRLYESVRVPLMEPRGEPDPRTGKQQLMPVLDHKRRQVWEIDPETNRPKEDFSLLTGQDICEALMRLERIRLGSVPRVSELLGEAIYAKMTAGDIHDDKWWEIMDGTVADKTSVSNRESRPDRYHAFFRYRLWLTSKEFLDEVGRFMDRLEKIGTWKSFERG